MKNVKRLITAGDLADRLGLEKMTIYFKVRHGQIPGAVRLGRLLRFDESVIDAWIAQQLKSK